MSPKLALSGVSSFTGYWLAREIALEGWQVRGLCSSTPEQYKGLRRLRLQLLDVPLSYRVNARTGELTKWIEINAPEVLVLHHHWMTDFRKSEYDRERARAVSIEPLADLVRAAQKSETRLLFSSSYFEPGEGGTSEPATPYAQSKAETWGCLSRLCSEADVLLARVVIPNPVGAFENCDRLIPIMLRKARAGDVLTLTAPETIADQLPARNLAAVYLHAARELQSGTAGEYRPSGWQVRLAEFVETVNRELIEKRLGWTRCAVEISDAGSGVDRRNREPLPVDWAAFWDDYAQLVRDHPLIATESMLS